MKWDVRSLFFASIWAILIFGPIIVYEEWGGPEPVDLGVATYPVNGPHYSPSPHQWDLSRGFGRYEVAYAYGKSALAEIKRDHESLTRRCRRRWDCIYPKVYQRSAADLSPLLHLFKDHAIAQEWNRTEVVNWLLAFVQHIRYEIPERYAFGVLPPALVVALSYGDCDSKSLLLMHLLAAFDIESELLVSRAHRHAMVAIHMPGNSKGFGLSGRNYLWAETTSTEAPLGYRDPRLKSPDDWRAVRTR